MDESYECGAATSRICAIWTPNAQISHCLGMATEVTKTEPATTGKERTNFKTSTIQDRSIHAKSERTEKYDHNKPKFKTYAFTHSVLKLMFLDYTCKRNT